MKISNGAEKAFLNILLFVLLGNFIWLPQPVSAAQNCSLNPFFGKIIYNGVAVDGAVVSLEDTTRSAQTLSTVTAGGGYYIIETANLDSCAVSGDKIILIASYAGYTTTTLVDYISQVSTPLNLYISNQSAVVVPANDNGAGSVSGGGNSYHSYILPSNGISVMINNGAAVTKNSQVTLSLFGGGDARRMAVSNVANFEGTYQEPYTVNKTWFLSKGEGQKQVYVKFYNEYGWPSSVATATIAFDDTTPATHSPHTVIAGVKNYPDHSILRGPKQKMYLLADGKMRFISNLKVLDKNAKKTKIYNVSAAVLDKYLKNFSTNYPEYGDGVLLRSAVSHKIYYITAGIKKYVSTPAELKKYKGLATYTVDDGVLERYPASAD